MPWVEREAFVIKHPVTPQINAGQQMEQSLLPLRTTSHDSQGFGVLSITEVRYGAALACITETVNSDLQLVQKFGVMTQQQIVEQVVDAMVLLQVL
jgi:hypothetical protein